ncbi:trehalose-phosphatase, partial [Actinomadura logoneensis]
MADTGHVHTSSSPHTSPEGEDALAALRDDPAGAVLGFDFDGTLAPIVADPAAARAHPRAAAALAALAPRVRSL